MKNNSFTDRINIRREYQANKKFRFFVQLFCVVLGAVISGASFCSFFKPAGIISSGLSGLAQLISRGIFGNYTYTTVVYIIINVFLFLIALKLFGWKFIVFTLFGIAAYTVSMQYFAVPELVKLANSSKDVMVLYSLIGGGLSGVGQGIAFRMGGSTGGSDIAAKIINKFFPKIKTGVGVLIINAFVITITIIVTRQWDLALYAVIVAVISTITCDMVLDGSKAVCAFYIICDKDDEISAKILQRFHRGVTVIPAQGKFSQQDKKVLLCLVAKTEAREVKEIVKDTDKSAFVFSTSVSETIGEGYFMREASAIRNKINKSRPIVKKESTLHALKSRPRKVFGKKWKQKKMD